MNFRQYTVPEYGGYIGIVTDTELYNRLEQYDAGLPLCEYGTDVNEIFLTTNGSELRKIFKDKSVKFAVWSWGPSGGLSTRTLEDKFKNPLLSVFTSSQFQVAFGSLTGTTTEVTRQLAAKTGASAPTIYTKESDIGSKGVFVDIETPPARYMMGTISSNNEDRLYDSIITGLIVQTEDGTGQLWLSIAVEVYSEQVLPPIYPGVIINPPYYIKGFRQTVSTLDAETIKTITDNAIAESSEPYGDGENPNPDGGNGSQDDTTDEVEEPETPGLSAVDTGFCSIYAPTKAQLNELSEYIWSDDWWDLLDNLRNVVINPMSAIMSLVIVPVTPDTNGLRCLKLGRWDTGINMPPVINQFTTVDCGELFIQPYYNTFLDYQPNTSIEIYLPFIGSRPLDPDVVTGRTVGVKYMFDVVTGFCVAFITVDGSVFYTFNGQSSINLPVTQLTHANIVGSTLSALSTLVTMKAAPMAQAFQVPDLVNAAVNAPKQTIEKTGNISGSVGYMANRTPYLTITRPNLIVNPEGGRQKLLGYPCEQFYRLGDLKGFTVVEDVQLHDIPAPVEVQKEIENLLKQGVIL